MNTPVRLLSLFIIFIYGAFVPADIMAETRNLPAVTVVGIVTDQEGEPLIGVNIQVKGSSKGTSTDFDGKFTLEDIDENAVLVVSYVGYQTQEVPIAGKSNLDIVMISDSQLLDEVVVVGHGSQRRQDITSAISVLNMDNLEEIPASNASRLLQGQVSGVDVKQRNGTPGSQMEIAIRGISSLGA